MWTDAVQAVLLQMLRSLCCCVHQNLTRDIGLTSAQVIDYYTYKETKGKRNRANVQVSEEKHVQSLT